MIHIIAGVVEEKFPRGLHTMCMIYKGFVEQWNAVLCTEEFHITLCRFVSVGILRIVFRSRAFVISAVVRPSHPIGVTLLGRVAFPRTGSIYNPELLRQLLRTLTAACMGHYSTVTTAIVVSILFFQTHNNTTYCNCMRIYQIKHFVQS